MCKLQVFIINIIIIIIIHDWSGCDTTELKAAALERWAVMGATSDSSRVKREETTGKYLHERDPAQGHLKLIRNTRACVR